MKVLFLVSSLPIKKLGGTEIITLRIADRLAGSRMYEPYIYTIATGEEEKNKEALEACFRKYRVQSLKPENIIFAPVMNTGEFMSYTRSELSFALNLEKVLTDLKPDVMVCMKVQPPDLFSSWLPRISRKLDIPYIMMIRGFTDLTNTAREEGYARELGLSRKITSGIFYKRLLPRYISSASQVVAQTGSQADFALERYGRECQRLFNPIDLSELREVLMNEDWLASFPNYDSLAFNLVYVGSMIPRKSVGTLLLAVHHIREKGKTDPEWSTLSRDLKLTLLGGGSGLAAMQKLGKKLDISDSLFFPGKKPPAEFWPFLRHCQVFVFPSLSEGFPNALLEAMACGLPVISSDFAGVQELIRNEDNGLIFPRGDYQELAYRIKTMYDDEDYRSEVSLNNARLARDFNWDSFMENLEAILEVAVRRKKEE